MGSTRSKAESRPLRPRRADPPQVAVESSIQRENLPLPFVHYPSLYGTFFGFSETEADMPLLCECALGGVRNYLAFQAEVGWDGSDPSGLNGVLSERDFPHAFAEMSMQRAENPLEWIASRSGLCHRCNSATPTLRYCHEMYGGIFTQYHGWYINQAAYRLGVHPVTLHCLEDAGPLELVALLSEFWDTCRSADALQKREVALSHWTIGEDASAELRRLQRRTAQLHTQLKHYFENITRSEFGYPAVGKGRVGEMLLHKLVVRLLPGHEVLWHHRPPWLDGLELDVFVPDLGLALEYQGQQHFPPISAWGSEDGLSDLQGRDTRKAAICADHGVCLVTIDYTEPLTELHVQSRIRGAQEKGQGRVGHS